MKNSIYSIDINKALIYSLTSVIITLVAIFVFIVPTMKEYKVGKIKNRHAKKAYHDTKKYYDSRSDELKMLKRDNKRVMESLNTAFDDEKFQENLNLYMSDLAVDYTNQKELTTYFQYRDINISGEFPNPANLFESIKSFNQFKNVVSVEFPITIKSKENSKILWVNFPAKDYSLKELNTTFELK